MEFSPAVMSWIPMAILVVVWVVGLALVVLLIRKLLIFIRGHKESLAQHGELVTLVEKLLQEQKRTNELLDKSLKK